MFDGVVDIEPTNSNDFSLHYYYIYLQYFIEKILPKYLTRVN